MHLHPITQENQIKKGDILVYVNSRGKVCAARVKQIVDHPECKGREIIIQRRKNHFFNERMYLKGESWIKDIAIVHAEQNAEQG